MRMNLLFSIDVFPLFLYFFFFFFLLSFFFLLFILPFYSEFIPCFCFGSCLFDKLSRAFEKDKVKVSFFSEFLFFFFYFIYLFIYFYFFFFSFFRHLKNSCILSGIVSRLILRTCSEHSTSVYREIDIDGMLKYMKLGGLLKRSLSLMMQKYVMALERISGISLI